ncbi:MAG: hypothetical protein WEE64_11310 [Dehalococcoidia bacterium]
MSDAENTILPNQLPAPAQQDELPAPQSNRTGGPATPQGKATNWIKHLSHGLRSNRPVIPHMEDEGAWYRHLDGVRTSLAPEGAMEHLFVERIASLTWRLYRVIRYEVVATMHHIGETETDLAIAQAYLSRKKGPREVDPDRLRAHQQKRIVPASPELDKIMRYETHLHRQFLQTLHELEALQSRRKGEPVHLARVDVGAAAPD